MNIRRIQISLSIVLLILLSGCSTNMSNNANMTREATNTSINIINDVDLSCNDCNVIFLDIDLLRADYVELINHEHNATPNIDKFFENAIIFEDASSPSGLTKIGNLATLTARDGVFIQIRSLKNFAPKNSIINENNISNTDDVESKSMTAGQFQDIFRDLPTIAQVLQTQKYLTIDINEDYYAQSGKSQGLDRGFDVYLENKPFMQQNDTFGLGINKFVLGEPVQITNKILKNVETENKKFFLLLRLDGLHSPYDYPKDRPQITDPGINSNNDGSNFTKITIIRNPDKIIILKNSKSITHSVYKQQLIYIDEELGKIFSYLENSSMLNNTIIVLYSNHGDGLFDNEIFSHGVAYQSCVHVPILIRHPKIKEPIRIKQPISLIDLTPTIYEMINANAPKDIDGISLIQTITYGTYNRTNIYGLDEDSKYIRVGDMKLIVWKMGGKQLYNITADPHEQNNIATKYPEIVNNLYQTLINHQLNVSEKVLKENNTANS